MGITAVLCAAIAVGASAFKPVGPATGQRISFTGDDTDIERDAFLAAVAYNPNRREYLVVFEADELADEEFNIFAQRVTGRGRRIGGLIQVSNAEGGASRDARDPAVAFNPKRGEYLVVFRSDGLGINAKDEIDAQRIGARGASIGNDFRISATGDETDQAFDASDADVAYNSKQNQYLAVWDADGTGINDKNEIYGQRLSATGAQLGGATDTQLSTTPGDDFRDATNPAVAYGAKGNRYLVVFQADPFTNDNESEVFGQRLSGNGAQLGGDSRLSTTGPDGDADRDSIFPDVAYNSRRGQFLVIWEGDRLILDEDEIFGQRFTPAGAQRGPEFRISNIGADGDPSQEAFDAKLAYNARANEYLAVFTADRVVMGFEAEIFGQRVSAAGRQLDGDFRISKTGADGDVDRDAQASAVAAGVGQYLAVWEADGLATDEEVEVFARRIVAPRCFGKAATRVGTKRGEVLRGTKKADVIVGLRGADTLVGRGGNDRLCGNGGNDQTRGGPGRDRTKP